MLAELSGSTPTATYIRSLSIDEPFIRKQTGGDEFYQVDVLGSALALTDGTGTAQTTYTYEPFGKTAKTGPSSNSFQYTGREDDGTGLYYYRARYYSPIVQRFISEDPLGFSGGDFNIYAYVGNKPLLYRDPTGLFFDTILDLGFIAYDVYQLAISGRKDIGANLTALGLDVAGALTPGVTGLGLTVRAGKKFSAEQDALIQMAQEAKRRGGVTPEDAVAFKELAKEADLPFRGPEKHADRNFTDFHIHVGPVNHIPVK